MWRQIAAVTWLNLTNLASRTGASLIIVVGIGGVVAVLLGLLAMSAGFRAALTETARPDRVLLVRGDTTSEIAGSVDLDQLRIIEAMPGIDVASGEVLVTIAVKERGTGTEVDVAGRGVTGAAFELRDEVEIVAGRNFQPGTNEIIVGTRTAARYQGLDVGSRLPARTTSWVVVGHFAAAGTAVESEIWLDQTVAQDVFRRAGSVSVVRARLSGEVPAAELSDRVEADPRLGLRVIPEPVFFAQQTENRTALINAFAYFIATIMAIGAVLAALNTMYVAVSRRTTEIATLRTLGFSGTSVIASVLVEAMLLALAGGLLGALLVYLALDGYSAATFNDASSTQVAFAFRVTPELARTGLAWALVLGFVGGFLPALRAARLPLTEALRGE
ncbi:MAG: FtsX-like permease family protein [Gammaproteobacteria bacterium]|jgi:putative ABC transport system permease protein